MYFIKRENRNFHVVVVQKRAKKYTKSVMHVQSCCFAHKTYCFFFWHSRFRPGRWILKSLLLRDQHWACRMGFIFPARMVTISQEMVRENYSSRSGKSQRISLWVRENLSLWKKSRKIEILRVHIYFINSWTHHVTCWKHKSIVERIAVRGGGRGGLSPSKTNFWIHLVRETCICQGKVWEFQKPLAVASMARIANEKTGFASSFTRADSAISTPIPFCSFRSTMFDATTCSS